MDKKRIKIFVTGFFNSGKSTLVHTLDGKSIHVEKELNVMYEKGKTHTTTGFDLGRLMWVRPNLNIETVGLLMNKTEYFKEKDDYAGWHTLDIELKGCPGQMQFSAVRRILAKGSDGVILLIDGCDLVNIGNALVILEETKANLGQDIPMRIIANKSDREDFNGSEMISNMVGEQVYEGSAKCNVGIKDAIIHVSKIILYGNNNNNNVAEKEVAVEDG